MSPRTRHVVDAMNVVGSRPDGWWRDRDGALERLVVRLQGWRRRHGEPVATVIDGAPLPGLAEGVHDGVLVTYAGGGRDAADHRIVAEVAADADPASLLVHTSDSALRRRVEALGARTRSASALQRELDPRGGEG